MRSDTDRLPLQDLERLAGRPAAAVIAAAAGRCRRTVCRWRKDGVPRDAADGLAVAFGRHPAEIWGAIWWDHR